MRFFNPAFLFAALLFLFCSCSGEKDHLVTIKTKYGDMKAILYDETPKHKENFLKLAREGALDSTTFHRVINHFMIQGGDVNAKADDKKDLTYTVDAEFVADLIHEKGALAAARQGDQLNPTKASSASQFYIVQGQVLLENELKEIVEGRYLSELQRRFSILLGREKYKPVRDDIVELQQQGDMEGIMQKIKDFESVIVQEFGPIKKLKLTPEQIETYTTIGGTPHLDGEYTVFGKVIDGLSVIDSIAAVPTGTADKPLEDIYMDVEVEEVSKKKIEAEYGYEYPEKQ